MTQIGNLHIIAGPPGAGKSTFSAKLSMQFNKSINIEGDTLYNMVVGGHCKPWENKGSKLINLMLESFSLLATNYSNNGFDIIFNYVLEHSEFIRLGKGLTDFKGDIFLYFVLPDEETLVLQDKHRPFTVGEDLVRKYHHKFSRFLKQNRNLTRFLLKVPSMHLIDNSVNTHHLGKLDQFNILFSNSKNVED